MKVVEPPPLSDTTCSSSPRPATVSKYQRIKMDFCVPFVLYLYILYFVFLASSLAQLALLRRDRQPSVNINESKIYSRWKNVLQRTNNGKNKTIWQEDFCDIWLPRKRGKQEKVNISTDQKFIPIEKGFCKERWQNQNNLMGRFLWHLAAEKNGKQEIYSQPTKNEEQLITVSYQR